MSKKNKEKKVRFSQMTEDELKIVIEDLKIPDDNETRDEKNAREKKLRLAEEALKRKEVDRVVEDTLQNDVGESSSIEDENNVTEKDSEKKEEQLPSQRMKMLQVKSALSKEELRAVADLIFLFDFYKDREIEELKFELSKSRNELPTIYNKLKIEILEGILNEKNPGTKVYKDGTQLVSEEVMELKSMLPISEEELEEWSNININFDVCNSKNNAQLEKELLKLKKQTYVTSYDDIKMSVIEEILSEREREKEQAKPDSKPESKPESKPDSKPEAKPDSKTESKPEAKPDSKPESKPEAKPDSKPDSKPEAKPEVKPDSKLNQAILHDFVRETIKKDESEDIEFTASQEAEIKKEEEARRKSTEEKSKLESLEAKIQSRLKNCQDNIEKQNVEIKRLQAEQKKKIRNAIENNLSDDEMNEISKEYENKINKCKNEIQKLKNTLVTLNKAKTDCESDKSELEKKNAEQEATRLKEIQEQIKREKATVEPPVTPTPPKTEYETEIDELKDELLEFIPNTEVYKKLKVTLGHVFEIMKSKYNTDFAGKEITSENFYTFSRIKLQFDDITKNSDSTKKENFMKKFDNFVTKYYGYVVPEFNKDIDKIKNEFYSMLPDDEDKTDFDQIFENLKNKYDSTVPVPDIITSENKNLYTNLKNTMKTSLMDQDEAKREAFFEKYDLFVEKHFGKEEVKEESKNEKTYERDYSNLHRNNIDKLPNVYLKYLQHAANNVNFAQAIENAGNIQEISDRTKDSDDWTEFSEAMKKGLEDEDNRMVFKAPKGLRSKLIEMKMRYAQRRNMNYGIVRSIIGYKDLTKRKKEDKKITELIMMDINHVRAGHKPITKYVKNIIKENKKKMSKKEDRYAKGSKAKKLEYLQLALNSLEKSGEEKFLAKYEYGDVYCDKNGKRHMIDDVDGKIFEIHIDQVKEALTKQIEFVKSQKEQEIVDEELGL